MARGLKQELGLAPVIKHGAPERPRRAVPAFLEGTFYGGHYQANLADLLFLSENSR